MFGYVNELTRSELRQEGVIGTRRKTMITARREGEGASEVLLSIPASAFVLLKSKQDR